MIPPCIHPMSLLHIPAVTWIQRAQRLRAGRKPLLTTRQWLTDSDSAWKISSSSSCFVLQWFLWQTVRRRTDFNMTNCQLCVSSKKQQSVKCMIISTELVEQDCCSASVFSSQIQINTTQAGKILTAQAVTLHKIYRLFLQLFGCDLKSH